MKQLTEHTTDGQYQPESLQVRRLGSKHKNETETDEARSRPLLVTFPDEDKTASVIKNLHKLKTKGIFWSFAKDITLEQVGDKIFLEYLLKYGDFDDLILAFRLYDKEYIKSVWEEKLKSDKSFIKLNFMLARVFFGMDVESSYFKEVKNARAEKFKMFAS
jgi:hypothetical protein